MASHGLTVRDRDQLEARGIAVSEALRQLALLRDPPPKAKLARPATLGDGILPLPEGAEAERLTAEGRAAAQEGRLVRFVPASGAASRLFAELRAALAAGSLPAADSPAGHAQTSRAATGRSAEHPALARFESVRHRLPMAGGAAAILRRYGDQPKALIPFHRYPDGERRTALEEHLVEAAAVLGGRGTAAVHLSVADRQRPAFEALLGDRLPVLERRLGCGFEVTLSRQSPATDSLAVDMEGHPFRTADDPASPLLLRPGGHGALLGNLQSLADRGAELVAIKNIDNVQPEQAQGASVRSLRILAGMARELAASSDRPARTCGVVPAVGAVGGGPFWVREASGEVRLQIVETAQIDREDSEQAAILHRSTHFNPVFMVCAARREDGSAYVLEDFVDHDACLIVHRSHGGRELVAIERPGLWNGAMAGWETRFVALPAMVFTPVKTVFDLASVEHSGTEGDQ